MDRFCPVCRGFHDDNAGCFEGSRQLFGKIKEGSKKDVELKKISKEASRAFIKIVISIILLFIIGLIVFWFIPR